METRPQPSGIPAATDTAATTTNGLFDDLLDTAPYEKNLKRGRIYLYVVAAIQVGVGIYYYANTPDETLALIVGGIPIGIGLLFLAFAFWSYKKPAAAFLTALITFVVAHVLTMIDDPSTIIKGILLKILVVIALVKAYKDAREVEKIRRSLAPQQ